MAENSKIAWTTHTWNPVTGCMKVSPGCDHCYAEGQAKRNTKTFGQWGPGAARKRTSADNWRKVDKWHREAIAAGERHRVFTASMADVFDNAWEPQDRADMWDVIRRCTGLDFLLLTKRPQNIAKMLPPDWGPGWPNVWLGCTAENQAEADRRIPHLLAVPAVVRFLSCEPLLGPLHLVRWDADEGRYVGPAVIRSGGRTVGTQHEPSEGYDDSYMGVDWVISGGESGPGARPMRRVWDDALQAQCQAAGIAFFRKQLGSNRRPGDWPDTITGKGDDPTQWLAHLRVQQFPQPMESVHAQP